MTGMIRIAVGDTSHLFSRDLLATAILLRLDHPDSARAVVDALELQHGVEHYEAMRLTVAAQKCINDGIEP